MKSETEDPFGIVRPSQPPVEAFESPFVSWPVKKVFEHFKARYYEPFKDLESSRTPKIATHNCVILDERTCSDGTCLLVSDTPAGDLYDKDLPHTARCKVGFALSVLGDCEIMNGDLVEYNMNYGDNPDHVLKEKGDEEDAAGEGEDDVSDEENEEDEDEDEDEDDEDEGKDVEKEQDSEEGDVEDPERQHEEDEPENEATKKDDVGHQSKRRRV
jgi:hypothetical protein